MKKITVLGIMDVIVGALLVFSELARKYEESFRPITEEMGLSWNTVELALDWIYLPASILLIGTGLILVGYIVILR